MEDKRYRSFSDYLKERFGTRVQKVTVSAGFTCPNRDGHKGFGGCIYCNNEGFNPNLREVKDSIPEQVRKGMDFLSRKYKAKKFILYFQPFTNTYSRVEHLRKIYDEAIISDDIVGISIGTRPDCVPEEILDLLEEYAERYMIWLEIGLQSMHDRTLKLINRGHDLDTFLQAVERVKRRKAMLICTHIIHGLPGEKRKHMLQTVKLVAGLNLDGIKFHNLHVMKNTTLEKIFRLDGIRLLTMDEYVRIMADSLELLPPEMVILRLSGDAPEEVLVAPEWCRKKFEIQEKINRLLERRGTKQGDNFDDEGFSLLLKKMSRGKSQRESIDFPTG
jgi:radical SAM protein (TIGR01212 family)